MVEVPEVVLRPDELTQFFPGNDLSLPFQQRCQDPEGLVLYLERPARLPHFARFQVDFEIFKASDRPLSRVAHGRHRKTCEIGSRSPEMVELSLAPNEHYTQTKRPRSGSPARTM